MSLAFIRCYVQARQSVEYNQYKELHLSRSCSRSFALSSFLFVSSVVSVSIFIHHQQLIDYMLWHAVRAGIRLAVSFHMRIQCVHTHTHSHTHATHSLYILSYVTTTYIHILTVCVYTCWLNICLPNSPIRTPDFLLLLLLKKYNKHTTVHMHTHRTNTYTHREIERKRSVHSFTHLFAHS